MHSNEIRVQHAFMYSPLFRHFFGHSIIQPVTRQLAIAHFDRRRLLLEPVRQRGWIRLGNEKSSVHPRDHEPLCRKQV